MSLVWRYQCALIAGFIAMFVHVYALYGLGDFLSLTRLSSAIGSGLIFGHMAAFSVLAARDLPGLLEPKVGRLRAVGMSLPIAAGLAAAAWWAHSAFYLLNAAPDPIVLLIGGLLVALGFGLPASSQSDSPVIKMLLAGFTTACILACIVLPILLGESDTATSMPRHALLYFRDKDQMWTIGTLFALILAIGGQLPLILSRDAAKAAT